MSGKKAQNGIKEYEAIVIGAGVSGLYQLKRLIDLGVETIALEANEGVGGTWFKNRYPGCRFDSESYTYGYSFSEDLLAEWHWKERFSSQPENLKYMNFVADKFDLRRRIRCGARVDQMIWSEEDRLWRLTLQDGAQYAARFVFSCMGPLNVPTMPRIEGIDSFEGRWFHSYDWPSEPIDLSGLRVGVIGTGATGIQIISEIADKVGHLSVFQREPNWSVPLNNSVISIEEMQAIRQRYPEIFENCKNSPGGFEHVPDPRKSRDVSREERIALWDALYDTPGFALLLANFPDTIFDLEANKELSEYVAERIRRRVRDPELAEKLIPKDHGFGMKRVPLETRYFEAYNRDNVRLVDISETPIERIAPFGVQTSKEEIALDLIVYATGFNAGVGALERCDIQGVDGQQLGEKWRDGPSTYFGFMTHGFPNLMILGGPQGVSGSTNYPRAIETGVDWLTRFFTKLRQDGVTRFEVSEAAEQGWVAELAKVQQRLPFHNVRSWFTGYNPNLEGKNSGPPRYVGYWGGAPRFRAKIEKAETEGYRDIARS